jgi:S1-C subfamily serine protease
MQGRILPLLLTVTICGGAHAAVVIPQNDGGTAFKSVADRVHSSVVAVRAQAALPVAEGNGPQAVVQTPSFGTGVLLGNGLAVTTLHTVGNLLPGRVVPWNDIEVLVPDAGFVGATLVGWFPDLDLAVLRLASARAGESVELADTSPPVGEALLAMGTDDDAVTVIGVNVAAVKGDQLLLSSPRRIDSRYWGGPLFDIHGRLAGINLPSLTPRALTSPALAGLLESFRQK